MQKIWNWLLLSSEHPGEIALTVKASLVASVTILTVAFNFAHLQFPAWQIAKLPVGDLLTPVVDALIAVVQALFGLISAIMVVWGLMRKVINTFKGQHASIQ